MAGRKAKKLLGRVVLPHGARRIGEPPVLARRDTGISLVSELAWRFAFWRVRRPLQSVYAFVQAHPPPGFSYIGGGGLYRSLDFSNGVMGSRQRLLTVDLAWSGGRTLLRLEAGVPWIYPRSPHEVVPGGVREIDIRDGRLARRVTHPRKVVRIVPWFDALNVLQPGTQGVECPLLLASSVRLTFRSATGARLASATVPSRPSGGCNPISFSIRGKRQTPLIDATFGRDAFVNRVRRLLGLRLPNR